MVIITDSNGNSTMLLDLNKEVTLDPPLTHKRNCRLRMMKGKGEKNQKETNNWKHPGYLFGAIGRRPFFKEFYAFSQYTK